MGMHEKEGQIHPEQPVHILPYGIVCYYMYMYAIPS